MAFELVKEEEWRRFVKVYEGPYYHENEKRLPTYKELSQLDMPCRSTMQSAGYDFRIPYDLKVKAGEIYMVGTGVKWDNQDAELKRSSDIICRVGVAYSRQEYLPIKTNQVYLALYPRSSYGFNYGFHLLNTTGIIDADYYSNPQNDGHIMVGFTTTKDMELKAGDKFCQGIITPYFICEDEEAPVSVRTGGTGSTGK